MEAAVKKGELEANNQQRAKMAKKKEITNLIKAVEYSLKIANKNAAR